MGNANDELSLVKKRRSPNHKRERRKFTSAQSAQSRPTSFTPTLESNMARFASLEGSIETFIEEQENQNTVK